MTKRKLIWLIPVTVLLLLAAYRHHRESSPDEDMVQLTVVPFETDGGWGYRVMADHHSFIYQDMIPGIPGNRPFRTKEDAQRVGQAVVEKLMAHQRPTVTLTELMKMQVAGVQ